MVTRRGFLGGMVFGLGCGYTPPSGSGYDAGPGVDGLYVPPKDGSLPPAIIFAGQSNCPGKADIDEATDQTLNAVQPNVRIVRKVSVGALADPIEWTADEGPILLQPRADADQNFGPEISMGRALAEQIRDASIIQFGLTGSGLADHWLGSWPTDPAEDPDLLDHFLAYVASSLSTLGSRAGALVWTQGETDGLDQTDANAYATNLATFFAAVRAVYPGLPIVITRQNNTASVTYKATIRAAQAAFVAANPTNTILVDTDDIPLDDAYHFTADGYVTLGERCAAAVLQLLGVVNAAPVASFSTDLDGLEATFTDASTDPGDTIVAWHWDFDDGNTSNQQNPQHTYAEAGTYDVTLTVTDSHGSTHQAQSEVNPSDVSWTIDAEDGEGYPADVTELGAALTAADLWDGGSSGYDPNDFGIYLFQESSGDIIDHGAGGFDLEAFGASLAYQQTLGGHARKFARTFESVSHGWASTAAGIPDAASGDVTIVDLVAHVANTTTQLARAIAAIGTGPAAYVGGAASTRVHSGANGASSSTSDYGAVRSYHLEHNRTGGLCSGGDDGWIGTPTLSGLVTGKRIGVGSVPAVVACPTVHVGYMLVYFGSMPPADRKALRAVLGRGDAWSPP